MKLQVKNNNGEFLFEGSSEEFKIALNSGLLNNSFHNTEIKKIKQNVRVNTTERPTVRKRLPSDEEIENMRNNSYLTEEELKNINYVDVNNLDIQKSKSIATKDFMCPECKQWSSIKINGSVIFKDVESKEKTLYQLNNTEKVMKIKNNKEFLSFSQEDWQESLAQDDMVIVSNDYIEGECICCGSINPTSRWLQTYKNNKNDLQQICPICGSLMCYNIDRNGNNLLKCENDKCNYEIKSKEM